MKRGGKFFKTYRPFRSVLVSNWVTLTRTMASANGLPLAVTVPFTSPIQGFDRTYTPEDFRLAIRIEKRLRETDQHGVINRQISSLVDASGDTVEYYAALPFNTGFDTTGAWTCADGMYLFDDGRPAEAKDVATWGNLLSGALTPAGVASARLAFRQNKNERGLIRPMVMRTLIVPPDLEDTGDTIRKTTLAVGKSINDVNVDQNRWEMKVWDYLTSATAWFAMGEKGDLHELFWYWRVKPETASNTLSDNPDIWQARVRMSFVTGCDRPNNIRGSTGA